MIKNIKFKLTTSKKKKCSMCKKKLNGEDGFIEFRYEYEFGKEKEKICWSCFEKILKEINNDRKERKKKYEELIKKRILMGL